MKPSEKNISRIKDDSLYGLLSPYKSNYTYFRILVSDHDDSIIVQLTDNPGNFEPVPGEKFEQYRVLRRLEVGVAKISLKYVGPETLIAVLGPLLDLNIPPEKVVITDGIRKSGVYSIETTANYKLKIVQGLRKILNMGPQKKYEIVEKYFSGKQE